jgi:hypothetical protein
MTVERLGKLQCWSVCMLHTPLLILPHIPPTSGAPKLTGSWLTCTADTQVVSGSKVRSPLYCGRPGHAALSPFGEGSEVPLYSALHVFAPSSLITPWPKIYGYLSVDYLLKGTELDAMSTTFVLLERGRELLQENNRIENRDTSVKWFTF